MHAMSLHIPCLVTLASPLIPSVLLTALLLLTGRANAQDDPVEADPPADLPADEAVPEARPEPDGDVEDPLSRYRTRFDLLAERAIGTASKPVAFNWRRTNVHFAALGSFVFELNNFNTMRVGGMVRLPAKKAIVEFGLTYVEAWDSPSSRLLAYTPYRQPGRPNRLEFDFNVAFLLAEGVVTTFPRFFPAVQMVFNGYAGLRYIIYPAGWNHMRPGQVMGAILNPTMTEIELDNLDDNRLDAMQIDPGRYGLMVGFGNDIYFEQGLFVTPRVMFAVPILAPASGTELRLFADFNLAIGVAF